MISRRTNSTAARSTLSPRAKKDKKIPDSNHGLLEMGDCFRAPHQFAVWPK